jgi:tight adherence protein C
MNARLLVVATLVGWVGTTLLLARLRWFNRPSLIHRIEPYLPSHTNEGARATRSALSGASFRDVIGPLAHQWGAQLSRILGTGEDLAVRLRRAHVATDATTFRIRQLAWAGGALGAGIIAAQVLSPPLVGTLVLVVGAPLLAFLVLEQQVAQASARWQQRTFLELPVVTEQLGMLLSAGYSLGGALQRLSRRGTGACSTDLRTVCARTQQGVAEIEALREWADRVDLAELHRLVDVLALNREAGDLGRLIAEEARATRREVQRQMVEVIERRGQQVWIPVTVATLVPGVLFLTVPFIEAMRLFSGG